MYSKEFNNCYILLSNISQALENTKFIAGELSLIVSLVLYCPTSVYEILYGQIQGQENPIKQYNTKLKRHGELIEMLLFF